MKEFILLLSAGGDHLVIKTVTAGSAMALLGQQRTTVHHNTIEKFSAV
jgi:hypothetical protein